MRLKFQHPEADARDLRVGSFAMTKNRRDITFNIKPQQFENECVVLERTPHAEPILETRNLFWTKFYEDSHLEPGSSKSFPITHNEFEFFITVQRTWENQLSFDFGGLLHASGVYHYDQVTISFILDEWGVTRLEFAIQESADKSAQLEYRAFQDEIDLAYRTDTAWDNVYWVVHRSLLVSQLSAEDGDFNCATIDMGPARTLNDTTRYIQWEWTAPDELFIECVSNNYASPQLSPEQGQWLIDAGWEQPLHDRYQKCKNYSFLVRDPELWEVAKLITAAFRYGLKANIDDLIVVSPIDIAEPLINLPAPDDYKQSFYDQGVMSHADIALFRVEEDRRMKEEGLD